MDINTYLLHNNNEEHKVLLTDNQIQNIKKTINIMDEMFMIAPLSEDNMILYRGYDTQYSTWNDLFTTTSNIKEHLKFGIQPAYISTTTSENLGFYFTIINYNKHLQRTKLIFIILSLFIHMSFIKFLIILNTLIYNTLKDIPYTSNICCFTILHLDDGIPYIKLNNNNEYQDEILLPRDLEMTYMHTDDNYEILLNNIKGISGHKTKITAHHIKLSLTAELKKKYQKREKCIEYQVITLSDEKN
jgi:hypothetical protein